MFTNFVASSGETQSAWAKKLGISKSYLSDILNGNRTPGLELAIRIQRATGGRVPAESWVPEKIVISQPSQKAS